MAALNRIITDLRAELSANIQSIEPRRRVIADKDWKEYKPQDSQDIKKISADARTFQIFDFQPFANNAIGGSVRSQVGNISIVFSYPSSDRWSSAAQDDMMAIDSFILNNPSTVTGVSGRWCNPSNPITVEMSPDDARKFYTMTVLVYVEADI